jgi:hypothetical protein
MAAMTIDPGRIAASAAAPIALEQIVFALDVIPVRDACRPQLRECLRA